MNDLSDEQLAAVYLAGKEEALEILIKRYFKRVYNFLVRFVGNAKEAEDLTQEVFLKIWGNLKKFDQRKSFKVWLWRIVRNTGIDHLRRKKIIVFSELANGEDSESFSEKIADESESIIAKIAKRELAETINDHLAKLSEQNRAVLLLRYNQQMTFQEIADLLKEPMDTVKSRHRRELLYLKRMMNGKIPPF